MNTTSEDHLLTIRDEWQRQPLLTAEIPGIGGTIKQSPEDFQVEEIPAYEPSGEGEHLFLWIEKRDTSAEQLTRHLSQVLDVATRDIGVAGLKDRQAITCQYISVPARCAEQISGIDTSNISVLRTSLHGNKLRTGHSRGNRFSILVRDTNDIALEHAELIHKKIAEIGFPNYFGPQRYGVGGETLTLGINLLVGQKRPRDIPAQRRRFLLRLALSSAQSFLFDRALGERLTDGLLQRVLQGDVMQVAASRGPFVVDDVPVEQRRFDAGETTITGPMFGPKMLSPGGEPAERESRILQSYGLSGDNFIVFRKLTSGTRRPYVVKPDDFTITAEKNGLRFQFALPRGVYATSLLREFLKAGANL